MVKAELNYNPYLLETTVRFNANEPKINSMVEKYTSDKLQHWIHILPQIFYDEMNGWDFELDFSGTKIDFESLREAFNKADKGKDSVALFHKNELESVEQKKQRINELLSWFENNRNRKFDYDAFMEANKPLFDDKCSLIVVQGALPVFGLINTIIENVYDINELEHAAMENTPILFCVNEKNRRLFKENLKAILKRSDIIPEQIFFYLDTDMGYTQWQRIINELGVADPQIINSAAEQIISRYIEVYPMTAYIQRIISALRHTLSAINDILTEESEQNISISSGTRQIIESLDVTIFKLKNTAEQITERDNYETPDCFYESRDKFISNINNWNKRKIKITNDEDAAAKAMEFQKELGLFFKEFVKSIEHSFNDELTAISQDYAEIYANAGFGDDYTAVQSADIDLSTFEPPKIIQELLDYKEEKMVEQTDYIGAIKNLFNTGKPDEPKVMKRVVEYKYANWREHTLNVLTPVIDSIIHYAADTLTDFYNRIAEDYLEHLRMLIEQQTRTKEETAAQLSDDEQMFQADIDWFNTFQEKLGRIERG